MVSLPDRPPAPLTGLSGILLVLVLAGCGGDDPAEQLSRAAAQRAAGDLAGASRTLAEVVRFHPEHHEARRRLAEVQLESGNGLAAALEFRRAINAGADFEALRLALSRAWLEAGRAEEALDMLPLSSEPPERRAQREWLVARSRALSALGETGEAQAGYRRVLELDPSATAALVGLGELAMASGELEAAKRWLVDAERTGAGSEPVLWFGAELAYMRRDFAGSESRYLRLVELGAEAGPLPPQIGLARARVFLGDLDDAIGRLDAFLRGSPEDPRALFYRALAAYRAGDYETADRLGSQVLTRSSSYWPAYLLLGATKFALGDLDVAHTYLEHALRASPEYWPAQRLLDATVARLAVGAASDPSALLARPERYRDLLLGVFF